MSRSIRASLAVGIGGALLLSGCASTAEPAGAPAGNPATHATYDATNAPQPPPAGIVIDYQLGGGYAPVAGVGGVVRDSTEEPAEGLYSVCYVNGFQTQPADRDDWLGGSPDLVLHVDGRPLVDENWPDELILDTSTADKRQRIAAKLAQTLDRCASAGFEAIEIDNLDSYTRSDGRLGQDDAVALATLYAEHAHAAGLAIGQKNSAELGVRGRDEAGFDFAVAEECHRWDECALYTDVWDERVIAIEYADDLRGDFDDVCADPQVPASTILRDRDLTTPTDPEYRFAACGFTEAE
ncbi:endo alpha-1,4 polygalactosaminidase [Conyzicola sp.]|uniref:endo alpha-1,4 polygalactosaminidase n=1 Tax=Conyzicola sp. TaxID=1969404 RepID=UPI003989FBD0